MPYVNRIIRGREQIVNKTFIRMLEELGYDVELRKVGKVIEPGHIYELGYEKCTCPKVLSGKVTDPEQCECSRQSILFILSRMEPDSIFEVEILETVLRGAEHCRFRIRKN